MNKFLCLKEVKDLKILIVGANGQLGCQITSVIKKGETRLGKINEIYKSFDIKGPDSNELNITILDSVMNYINNYKPHIVINCAGYTDVDGCESNEDKAFKVNSIGAKNIATACEKIKSKLIYLSTDYIFDGTSKVPYKEYDVPNPLNIYGKTKLAGEKYSSYFCSRHFIIRTSWLFGNSGKNFVKTVINIAKEKGQLNVVNDQRGTPTNAEDLVHHILKLSLSEEFGIFNCSNNGECSWYELACKIIEYAKIDCIVNPITSQAFKRPAKRPAYSSLDNMALRCTIGDDMRHWEEALEDFIQSK